MTSKHTPGPWRVAAPPNKVCTDYRDENGNMRDTNWVSGGHAKTIVTCEGRAWMESGEEFANAQLIAAAPDLLSVALQVREACLFDDDDGQIGVSEDVCISSELFDRLCTAINKAEGRS